jgi:glycosyltransferase involved in cell wall biosynthesis
MTRPTISIVTPCYNAARYLRETIRSVLKQTLPPAEMVIVDDGSTDDSAEIAESYGTPVRVIRQANQGESAARNRGIREARGDYLLFLDADDLLEQEALERLATAVDGSPNRVAIMRGGCFDGDPSKLFNVSRYQSEGFFPHIVHDNLATIHSWLVPRALVLQVNGFSDEIQQFEDWDLWARIGLAGAELVPVDYVGALYRKHPRCQSITSPRIERARGHAGVMLHMSDGFLKNDALLQAHGRLLFWQCWTALHQARLRGIPWNELLPLARNVERIVRQGPDELRRLPFARLVRILGIRWAETMRNWLQRAEDPAAAPTAGQ